MSPRDLSRPLTELSYTVPTDEGGSRLDAFLQSRVPWRSRTDLQRRIRRGTVRVDGRLARKGARVRAGQVVSVVVDEGPATVAVPVENIPLHVIWEDEHLIALDKAAGTIVHPVGRHVMDTIINALHVRHRDAGGPAAGAGPMIVHRLDRETSGVLVLAKDPEARKRLGLDFETRRVRKTYLALVRGIPDCREGTIAFPIGPDPAAEIRLKMACVPDGRPSRTDYEVLVAGQDCALVRCRPRTGRQHQIRVHLAATGHPVLCDRLYGDPSPVRAGAVNPGAPDPGRVVLARQALHSESLGFTHPITGMPVSLHAPLPADMQALCGAFVPSPPAD